MNYTFTPSLGHRTKAMIATMLWNGARALIANFNMPYLDSKRSGEWQNIEDKVIEKLPQLPLPESLRKEILGFIRPIGLEILNWMEYHEDFLSRDCVERNFNWLSWTPQGTIDKKKTAEVLIKNENLAITNRYKLACVYCLEDDSRELWGSMNQRSKAYFYNEGHPSFAGNNRLVVFWTYVIKGEVTKLNGLIKKFKGKKISPYLFAFECAVLGAKKAATKHFLQTLTPRERKEYLVRFTGYAAYRHCMAGCAEFPELPKEHFAEVLFFLLSQMDEEQQIEVFKSYSYEVLQCLLDWPWQSHFTETANRMWDFLSEKDYNLLLTIIINKVINGYKDCNYQNLFGELWQQSPNAHKRYVIDKCADGLLLIQMFKIEDERNVKFILKNATLAEKGKIIFCNRGQDICKDLICGDKWDLIEFLIKECILSKDEMIKFKDDFEKRIACCCSKEFAKNKDKWDKFFQLLDDFIYGYSESVAKSDSSPPKIICNKELEEVTPSKKN